MADQLVSSKKASDRPPREGGQLGEPSLRWGWRPQPLIHFSVIVTLSILPVNLLLARSYSSDTVVSMSMPTPAGLVRREDRELRLRNFRRPDGLAVDVQSRRATCAGFLTAFVGKVHLHGRLAAGQFGFAGGDGML